MSFLNSKKRHHLTSFMLHKFSGTSGFVYVILDVLRRKRITFCTYLLQLYFNHLKIIQRCHWGNTSSFQ